LTHDWGCRLTLLVDGPDHDAMPQISGLLECVLPESTGQAPGPDNAARLGAAIMRRYATRPGPAVG
jgi:hypothetical protein